MKERPIGFKFLMRSILKPLGIKVVKEKLMGFKLRRTKRVVYSEYDPKTKEWSSLRVMNWGDSRLWPSPMSAAINYGLGVIEGLKAYRHKDGNVFIFRPEEHALRFVRSLEGLLMPSFPKEMFTAAVEKVVRDNIQFVPDHRGESLYIRPVAWGGDQLGLAPDPETPYTVGVWASPEGGYLSEGLTPIRIWLARGITRAMPGGIGSYKASANYVVSRILKEKAHQEGCQDALTVDGKTGKYIQELTGANIFVVKDNKLHTPSLLDNTILAGVTRKSLITLAEAVLKIKVIEKEITIEELLKADEIFCSGTAAGVVPINQIRDGKGLYTFGDGKAGEITTKLHSLLTGIHYGDNKDLFGWLVKVEPEPGFVAAIKRILTSLLKLITRR